MSDPDEIARRLARYAETEDARALWPDVTPAAFRAALEEVARVAAAVLGDAPGPVTLMVPPRADLRILGIGGMTAGMGALLGWWIETGRVVAATETRALFAGHLDEGRRRATRLRAELERVLGAFAARGVAAVVLKGAETAYRYFPDPGTRPTADLDLLVAAGDLPSAEKALRALGFTQDTVWVPQRGHWIPADPGRVGSLEWPDADSPWHVDLHVSLDRGEAAGIVASLGVVDPASAEPWAALAQPARVLPQPLHLAYLALHASSHLNALPMIRLVELVYVARQDFDRAPERWDAFLNLVRETRAARFVYPALQLADRLAPGAVEPRVLAAVRAAAPRLLRRAVERLSPATSQRLHPRPGTGQLLWTATPREALRVLSGSLWPRSGPRRVPLRKLAHIYRLRLTRILRAMGAG